MGDPTVSVVVTACADSPPLRSCLAQAYEQSRALHGELVLVFNAAEEVLSQQALRELRQLSDALLFEPTPGKSNALNRAVEACRGEVVAFTDDDAEPQPGWLAALTRPLLAPDRAPSLVGCGGPVEPIFPEETPSWLRARIESKHTYFLGPRHELGALPIEYSAEDDVRSGIPLGANCAYRREVFSQYRYDPLLGPNRQTGMRGGEDTLLAMQLLRDGRRLQYCPDARVRHPVEPERMTLGYVKRGYFMQGREWARIRHRLGSAVPAEADVRRKVLGLRIKLYAARARLALRRDAESRDRSRRLLLKLERWRGLLAELRSPASKA